MKFLKNKTRKLRFILLIIGVVFGGFFFGDVANFLLSDAEGKQGEISWGKGLPLIMFLNIHESPIDWLSVAGTKYERVMEYRPYYLKIPELNAIYFVNRNEDGASFKCTAYFAFLKTKEIIAISDVGWIGNGIGEKKESGGD